MNNSESFQIHLSSTDADMINGNKSDCVFNLPVIEIDSQQQIYISVQSAVIPYTFYNINDSNNVLNYTLNGTFFNMTITNGNYNVNTLKTWLNANLFYNFTVSYNLNQNTFTFTNSQYDFTFLSSSTCLGLLGFSSTTSSHFQTLTSTQSINLFPIQCVCVSTNIKTNNINKHSINNNSVLCSMPVDVNPYGVLVYKNMNGFRVNTFTNVISSLNIRIVDHLNNIINLNGHDWSITIQIDIIDYVN